MGQECGSHSTSTTGEKQRSLYWWGQTPSIMLEIFLHSIHQLRVWDSQSQTQRILSMLACQLPMRRHWSWYWDTFKLMSSSRMRSYGYLPCTCFMSKNWNRMGMRTLTIALKNYWTAYRVTQSRNMSTSQRSIMTKLMPFHSCSCTAQISPFLMLLHMLTLSEVQASTKMLLSCFVIMFYMLSESPKAYHGQQQPTIWSSVVKSAYLQTSSSSSAWLWLARKM